MGLKKGQTNNREGRPKGVPNKTTQGLRLWINDLLDENREQIRKDLKTLEPKDRVFLFEKLLKYSVPQLAATTVKTDLHKVLNEAINRGTLTEENLKQLAALIVEEHKKTEDE